MDLGLGVAFRSGISDYSDFSFGLSVDHIPGSSISFYGHSIDQDIEYPESNIFRKFTGFISAQLASNEFVAFLPRLLYQKQGPHQMLAATAMNDALHGCIFCFEAVTDQFAYNRKASL